MKKILSTVLALTLVFSLASAAMASEIDSNLITPNYQNSTEMKQANVALTVSSTPNIDNVNGSVDPQKDDTQNRVWNVTISAGALHWDLVENYQNHGKNWALKWDVEQHKYVKEYEDETEFHYDNISLASGETAGKSFSIANNSNFNVSQETTLTANSALTASPFSITSGATSTIVSGSSTTVTVTLDTTNLDVFKGADGFSSNVESFAAGTATVVMTAGEIYAENYNQ